MCKKTRPCLGNTYNIKIPEYEVLDNNSFVLHDHDYSLLKETCSEVLLSVNNFISSYKLYIRDYRVKYEYEKEEVRRWIVRNVQCLTDVQVRGVSVWISFNFSEKYLDSIVIKYFIFFQSGSSFNCLFLHVNM